MAAAAGETGREISTKWTSCTATATLHCLDSPWKTAASTRCESKSLGWDQRLLTFSFTTSSKERLCCSMA